MNSVSTYEIDIANLSDTNSEIIFISIETIWGYDHQVSKWLLRIRGFFLLFAQMSQNIERTEFKFRREQILVRLYLPPSRTVDY